MTRNDHHFAWVTRFLAPLVALACACSDDGVPGGADLGGDAVSDVSDRSDGGVDTLDEGFDDSGDAAESPHRASAEAAARSIDPLQVSDWLEALADDAMEGRDNLTAGGQRARTYIVGQLTALGVEPAGSEGWLQPFEQGVNVVGRLAGSDSAVGSEAVVVSAHYDHLGVLGAPGSRCRQGGDSADTICNGAADNAAGVSAVLAVAKALAASEVGPRRTVLFAFWDAEEDGLIGSTYFVEEAPLVALSDVVAMFSVDNVGTEIVPGFDGTFALGAEYSDGLDDIVTANNDEAGVATYAASSFFVGEDSGGRSDHLPFRLAQVPSIFFGSGSTDVYHSTDDEIDAVNVDKLTRIARHVLLVTADVANREERVGFEPDPGPRLEDAEAILAVAEHILEDPDGAGVDPGQVLFIEQVADRMRSYLADPPETDAEWQAYQDYVEWVIELVYESL